MSHELETTILIPKSDQRVNGSSIMKRILRCFLITPAVCTCLVLIIICVILTTGTEHPSCGPINGGSFRGVYTNGTFTDIQSANSNTKLFDGMCAMWTTDTVITIETRFITQHFELIKYVVPSTYIYIAMVAMCMVSIICQIFVLCNKSV